MENKDGTLPTLELDELLEAERRALLNGDLDAMGRLSAPKEALLEQISASQDAPLEAAQDIVAKVVRNQELIDAALTGIRRVVAEVEALQRIRSNLQTYTREGKKVEINQAAAKRLERRA